MRISKSGLAFMAAASVFTSPALAKDEKAAPAVSAPPAGSGQVVFYRSSSMGALVSCRVHENGKVINRLPPGKYFVYQAAPGPHEFTVKSEATDKLRVEVEEGETQYVRCAIGMGIGVGRPNLSPQSREDFDKRGKSLKLVPPYEGEDKADESKG